MYNRLGGFWGLFFNSTPDQNSDGDFVSGNHKKIWGSSENFSPIKNGNLKIQICIICHFFKVVRF